MKRIVRMTVLGLMIAFSASVSAQSNELRRYIAEQNKALPINMDEFQSIAKFAYQDSSFIIQYYLKRPLEAKLYDKLTDSQRKSLLSLVLESCGKDFIEMLIRNKTGFCLSYSDSVNTSYFGMSYKTIDRLYSAKDKVGRLSSLFNNELYNIINVLQSQIVTQEPLFKYFVFYPILISEDTKKKNIKYEFIVKDETQFSKDFNDASKLRYFIINDIGIGIHVRNLFKVSSRYGYKIICNFYKEPPKNLPDGGYTLKKLKSFKFDERNTYFKY